MSLPLSPYRAPSPDSPAALELRRVSKSYGSHDVLRGIDLAVAPHEVVCLIGASGSGKSTLLRCVNLLEPVTAGSILLSGQEITAPGVNADVVRRHIGIVFQSFNLFPHMTVLRNITLGPVKAQKIPRAEADQLARDLLARFGLADRAGEYPDRLSGGQQQRVAMIRALAMSPRLMLFAEVTSALDPDLVAEVLDVIRELASGGMTMVIVTHEMNFAREIADHVYFTDHGVIVEHGPPDTFFAAPRDERTLSGHNPFNGATVINLSPAAADQLGLDPFSGVGVVAGSSVSTHVTERSVA